MVKRTGVFDPWLPSHLWYSFLHLACQDLCRTRVHQVAAAVARWRTSDSACTLGARTLFFDCWRRGLDRGSASSSSTSGGDPRRAAHDASQFMPLTTWLNANCAPW